MEIEEQEAHLYSEASSGTTIGNIAGNVFESFKNKEL